MFYNDTRVVCNLFTCRWRIIHASFFSLKRRENKYFFPFSAKRMGEKAVSSQKKRNFVGQYVLILTIELHE